MRQEHPQIHTPPPLIHLGALLVGYGLDRALDWSFTPPGWLKSAALMLALVGAALCGWTLIALRRHRTTVLPFRAASALVTDGPFRWSRNPIYLGFALLHFACGAALGSPGILLLLPLTVYVMDRHVIAAEEAFHEQQFPTQWPHYRERVRRWF